VRHSCACTRKQTTGTHFHGVAVCAGVLVVSDWRIPVQERSTGGLYLAAEGERAACASAEVGSGGGHRYDRRLLSLLISCALKSLSTGRHTKVRTILPIGFETKHMLL